MAETTVSQNTSTVKEISPIHLEFLDENRPAVLSTEVAERFQKRHTHILRDIDRLRSILPKSFTEPNFGLSEYTDATGRTLTAYLLTRDAFSLLVMGFTGSAAIRWKLKYIDVFNSLEAAALENRAEQARESGYQQGRDEALALPAMEKEHKTGYLEGLREGQRYRRRRDGLALLTQTLHYRQKGLNQNEIARLLGIRKQRVSDLLARARKLGVTL